MFKSYLTCLNSIFLTLGQVCLVPVGLHSWLQHRTDLLKEMNREQTFLFFSLLPINNHALGQQLSAAPSLSFAAVFSNRSPCTSVTGVTSTCFMKPALKLLPVPETNPGVSCLQERPESWLLLYLYFLKTFQTDSAAKLVLTLVWCLLLMLHPSMSMTSLPAAAQLFLISFFFHVFESNVLGF